MKPRKPAAARVPYEDASAAAIRSLRGHLELEEIEAALGVYRQARQAIAGWRPPPPEWLELIQGLIKGQWWDDARALARLHLKEIAGRIVKVLETRSASLDDTTRAHLEESKHRIVKVLEANLDIKEP